MYSKIKLLFLCCLPHPTIFLNDFMSKAKLRYNNYRTYLTIPYVCSIEMYFSFPQDGFLVAWETVNSMYRSF